MTRALGISSSLIDPDKAYIDKRQGTKLAAIRIVGVVGSGVMGQGIAQICAAHGFSVHLTDIDDTRVAKGVASIRQRLDREIELGKSTAAEAEKAVSLIQPAVGLDEITTCDLVIEAIVEAAGPKRELFQTLGSICKEDAVLATNTSSLSVSDLAGVCSRPTYVLGLHFFNPPWAMKLVELISTPVTSASVVSAVEEFCSSIDRQIVRVQDTPGFVVNRLLVPFIFDAIRLAEQGVAEVDAVDQACRSGLGHALGPLATADLIGLDTLALIGDSLFQEYGQPNYKPPVMLKRLVSLGYLGRKSGKGFYDYSRN